MIVFVIFPRPQWSWMAVPPIALPAGLDAASCPEGAGLTAVAPGQAPQLLALTPSHSLRSSHLKDKHDEPM